ncbi:MAG: tetratricopeptide repeat protein [Alphaproteobacteria bacterium]|nr:tetratricopeptide repeat protein [Alphaproteobacteria bacterium]
MNADAQLQHAIDLHRSGRVAEAEALYRAFLQAHPRHGEANHNLGSLLAQRGEMQQSLAFFKNALQADTAFGQYWISYARALISSGHAAEAAALLQRGRQQGLSGPTVDALMAKALISGSRFQEAAVLLQSAVAQQPGNAALLLELGYAFTIAEKFEDAIAAYRQALAINPGFAEAHFRLGSILSENGQIAEGFAHYMRRAALVYGTGKGPVPSEPEPEHKRKHDHEQRDYLAGGTAAPDAANVADLFHLDGGERLAGRAINPAGPSLMPEWHGSNPQMVVIDDFLTPKALDQLRRYCAGSTIWRRIYQAGYIGATPEDGFSCPLLAQIAEEILQNFAGILAPHPFHYLGAFKYDSTLSTGTNTHADNSAVNVNFYLTHDDANLDPDSGGMDIWDVGVPPGDDMRRYNGDEAYARDFLKQSNARMTRVPHRANRAVIFRSDLFHKTSDCRFEEGYLNKRINISLLFGRRGAPTR